MAIEFTDSVAYTHFISKPMVGDGLGMKLSLHIGPKSKESEYADRFVLDASGAALTYKGPAPFKDGLTIPGMGFSVAVGAAYMREVPGIDSVSGFVKIGGEFRLSGGGSQTDDPPPRWSANPVVTSNGLIGTVGPYAEFGAKIGMISVGIDLGFGIGPSHSSVTNTAAPGINANQSSTNSVDCSLRLGAFIGF